MQVHSFDKMNRHNHVRLRVLLRRVFDFAYAVYNCTNFAAGTFKRDAQYLTKNGLMCPDPNNSNDRRRFANRTQRYKMLPVSLS